MLRSVAEHLDSSVPLQHRRTKDHAMITYPITAPRHVPETYRSPFQSIVSPMLSTIGLFMSAFSEAQEIRREVEKLHRFAED
jgi:hypothetical protein